MIINNIRIRMNITDFILNRDNSTKIKWIKIMINTINTIVNIMKIPIDKLEIEININKTPIMMNMMIFKCKD
jgi:hypothetical protein